MALATLVLAGWAGAASLALLLAAPLDAGTFLDLPFGYFLAAFATPVVLMVAIFRFADRQRALDHEYDVLDD